MTDKNYELVYGASTSTSAPEEPLTAEVLKKAIKIIEETPAPPAFYYSKVAEPDDIYKIKPGDGMPGFGFFTDLFDNPGRTLYICGSNARDQLIEKGIVFENYQPEE